MIYKRCEHKARERDRCDHEWYASYQLRGQPRARVSLPKWTGRDVRTKTDAITAYDELKTEVRAGRFSPAGLNVSRPATPEGPLTFRWLVQMFETHYVKGKKLKTRSDFPYRVKPLLAEFGDDPINTITTTRVDDFYSRRRHQAETEGLSQAWTNRPISQLRSIINWAVKRGHLAADACPEFEIDSEDYSRWRRVSTEEEGRLLEAAAPLLRALLIVGLDTGTRRGEMLALRVGDVDLDKNVIRLRGTTTKDEETRDVPILTNRLRETLAWLQQSDQGFPRPALAPLVLDASGEALGDFRYHWARCRLKAYGFEPKYNTVGAGLSAACKAQIQQIDLHWHDLRHEFACRLDDRNVALGKIQRLLGHASIDTTQRYLRRGLKDLQTIVLDDGSLLPVSLPNKGTTLPQPGSPPSPVAVIKVGHPPSVVLGLPKTGTNE